jgi:hypothetical protein
MFRSMKEIVHLLDEADEARLLATGKTDAASVQNLMAYADELEAEAARLDRLWKQESSANVPWESHWSPVLVSHT